MESSDTWKIRSARIGDLASILEVLNGEIRTSASNFHWEPRPLKELEQEFRSAEGCYPWLVAELDGLVGGFAKASAFRPKQAYDWTAEVTVYLAPNVQGKGVGRALYTSLLEQLKDLGFHLAIGAITQPNAASEGLHQALGFHLVGVLREVGWKMDAWHDVAYWAKQLSQGPADDRRLPSAPG